MAASFGTSARPTASESDHTVQPAARRVFHEADDPAPGSARNNAATPRSPFSQPDLQTSPAKAPTERLRLPVLESLEDHELSGLTSLTGSELNLYLQVTEEMKREEPAMARRLLQSASFKRRQSQAEAAAAAPTGPAPCSNATQPQSSGATPQGSISSTSTVCGFQKALRHRFSCFTVDRVQGAMVESS
ncbi:hypothetical protein WJX84_000994 [Apatococcus fuscideae]|uniref:Uncharacterized protein n=1 Tax=Apatococcus fuscideae TaxID=2026836 RepID=A0AAW1T093_9CHLO